MEELEYKGYKFKIFENVYNPEEDSFLAVNLILDLKGSLIDIGCGTGILSIIYEREKREDVLGVDIDKKAVENSKVNAILNQSKAKFMVSDMFKDISDKKFDYAVFNSPYLGKDYDREEKEEYLYDKGQIKIFLDEVDKHIKRGFVLVLSDANERFNEYMKEIEERYKIIKISKKHFFFENIVGIIAEKF